MSGYFRLQPEMAKHPFQKLGVSPHFVPPGLMLSLFIFDSTEQKILIEKPTAGQTAAKSVGLLREARSWSVDEMRRLVGRLC